MLTHLHKCEHTQVTRTQINKENITNIPEPTTFVPSSKYFLPHRITTIQVSNIVNKFYLFPKLYNVIV